MSVMSARHLVPLLAAILVLASGAWAERPETAWEVLIKKDPATASDPSITKIEKQLLGVLTPEQAAAFARGADPATIVLADGQSLEEFLTLQLGDASFDLSWYTLDGGGGTSSAGAYRLQGTIGQPDVGVMTGGDYRITGGFWGVLRVSTGPPCNSADTVFCDGFESGDLSGWSTSVGRRSLEELPNPW